jgi:hypothetical protein
VDETHEAVMVSHSPNNVRQAAGLAALKLGQIFQYQIVKVLYGPDCRDGMAWWRIETGRGLSGWTAEGDASGYWLLPVDPMSPLRYP